MKKPMNTAMVPRGGWSVEIPGAGPPIVAHNWSEFIGKIRVRLEGNKLDHKNWKEEAVDLMCQQRPDIECVDDALPPSRAFTGDDVFRFLRTMWVTKEEGAQPVSEELQSQRVEICLQCPKLGYISCFSGCSSLSEKLSAFVIGRSIRKLPEIHKKSCLACGCSAEIKTMWPLDVIRKVDEQHGTKPEYHPSCWILNEPQVPNIPPNLESSSAQPPPEGT